MLSVPEAFFAFNAPFSSLSISDAISGMFGHVNIEMGIIRQMPDLNIGGDLLAILKVFFPCYFLAQFIKSYSFHINAFADRVLAILILFSIPKRLLDSRRAQRSRDFCVYSSLFAAVVL